MILTKANRSATSWWYVPLACLGLLLLPCRAQADQVIADDLIVQASLCVGFDCVNGEVFDFDTIRLKENNLRIHFDDTSVSAGFPANDWRIIANDSASGGLSKFSIEDSTGARVPFTIRAGAATNSLFVDTTGRIGLRTSTPSLDLHINTSDTPAHRLEQNNAGGFTAQTWDVAGNEANFFVRDVTSGSRLPFRIRPGAPTSSLDISSDGDIGMGTASPLSHLHIKDTGAVTLRLDSSNGATRFWDLTSTNGTAAAEGDFTLSDDIDGQTGGFRIPFTVEAGTPNNTLYVANIASGHVGIGTNLPDFIGATSSGGNVRHLNLNAGTGLGRVIVQGQNGAESYLVHPGSPVDAKIARTRVFAGRYFVTHLKDDLTNGAEVFALCVNLATGNVGVKCLSPTNPFQVGGDDANDGNGAHVTSGGVWTDASSRTFKDDIHPITIEQARETVRALQPVGYRYKNERDEKYVGFIAEDVPELVATKDRKSLAPMDFVAVLTPVVQDQDRRLDEQQQTIVKQQQTLTQQQQLIAQQQQILTTQQATLTELTRRLTELEQKSKPATDQPQPITNP